MGCGKSTVLGFFKESGWYCVESDAVVRALLSEDADVISAVGAHFGAEVVAGGQVDRAALARQVFGNAGALQWLEALLHPRVRSVWKAALADHPRVVVEIPLLFEKNLENEFDLTVCVSAGLPTQLQRLVQRGHSREQALARMTHQLPLADKERRAGYVISNNGTAGFARAQVAQLISLLHV